MVLAVMHVLSTIICVDLYRDYITKHKKYFSLHTILIAGVGGLLPDIDIPLGYVLQFFGVELVHRGVTHTPLFALPFLLVGLYLWHKKQHTKAVYGFVLAFGIMLHLLFDFAASSDPGTGVMFLYPFSMQTFELNLFSSLSTTMLAGLDALILLAWLWHEEVKHKIRDFI